MSTLSPSSAATPSTVHPQRAPPPSLFLGPPSRNASNVSLSQPGPSTQPASSQTRTPLLRSRSNRGLDTAATSAPLGRSRPPPPRQTQTDGARTDALWAEMQATLAEVQLSAFSSTHVFGSAHSAALDELREAQIALAQAWGRGEVGEDEALEEEDKAHGKKGKDEAKKDSVEGEDAKEKDEGEAEIIEARRRRKANEKFFKRVEEGVDDVVGKLEGVAEAMAKVERESRELWNEKDSVESGSIAS